MNITMNGPDPLNELIEAGNIRTASDSKRTGEGETPLLSVCMIVRNEQKLLPGCLQSIRDVADEIIVLDTGSDDDTREIAREYGAKVHEHPWQHDFSLHRNQVLALASGEWVLSIDADERLQPESAAILRELLAQTPDDICGLRVQIQDFNARGGINYTIRYPRLYRRIDGVYYDGIVHNQVHIPGKTIDAPIIIRHLGYDLDRKTMRRKFKRTVSLLRKQIRTRPDDPQPYFYLANTYSHYERHEKAVFFARKTIELVQDGWRSALPFLPIWHTLATSLIALQDLAGAREACAEALSHKQDYLDAWYVLGRIGFLAGDFEACGRAAERYLAIHEKLIAEKQGATDIPLHSVGRENTALFWQGLAAWKTGDLTAAMEFYQRALSSEKTDFRFAAEMVHNLFVLTDEQTATRVAKSALQRFRDDADCALLLAMQFARRGAFRRFQEELLGERIPAARSRLGKLGEALYALLHDDQAGALESLFEAVHAGQAGAVAPLSRLVFASEIELSRSAEQEAASKLAVAAILRSALSVLDGHPDSSLTACDIPEAAGSEIRLMAHLSRIPVLLQQGRVEELLQCFEAACREASVTFPQTFEDLSQLRSLLLQLNEQAKARNMPDAAVLALAVARLIFTEDAEISTMFEHALDTDARQNGSHRRLRWYFKFIFPTIVPQG